MDDDLVGNKNYFIFIMYFKYRISVGLEIREIQLGSQASCIRGLVPVYLFFVISHFFMQSVYGISVTQVLLYVKFIH